MNEECETLTVVGLGSFLREVRFTVACIALELISNEVEAMTRPRRIDGIALPKIRHSRIYSRDLQSLCGWNLTFMKESVRSI